METGRQGDGETRRGEREKEREREGEGEGKRGRRRGEERLRFRGEEGEKQRGREGEGEGKRSKVQYGNGVEWEEIEREIIKMKEKGRKEIMKKEWRMT